MADWRTEIVKLLRAALDWWFGELAALVPAQWRRRLSGWRSRIVLLADTPGDNLVIESGDRRRTLGHIDLESRPGAPARDKLNAMPRSGRHGTEATVRLGAQHALRTTISLPAATERNLDQVIGFEFERLAPFKRDDVYYAYRILSRDPAATQLRIELTVVPRAELVEVTRALQRRGLRMAQIEVVGASATAATVTIPVAGGDRPALRRRSGPLVAALSVTAAALAVACITIPLVRDNAAVARLNAQVAEQKRLAAASVKLQKQIDAERQGQEFLIARKRSMPSMTELLDTLTRLAPDDTFLTELQVTGGQVRLVGATASATALLALIDQSKDFRNAAFQSSITQDPRISRERFDIGARIAPKAAP